MLRCMPSTTQQVQSSTLSLSSTELCLQMAVPWSTEQCVALARLAHKMNELMYHASRLLAEVRPLVARNHEVMYN